MPARKTDGLAELMIETAIGAGVSGSTGVATGEIELRYGENAAIAANIGGAVVGGVAAGVSKGRVREGGKAMVNANLSLLGRSGRMKFEEWREKKRAGRVDQSQKNQADTVRAAAARAKQEQKDERFANLEIKKDGENAGSGEGGGGGGEGGGAS